MNKLTVKDICVKGKKVLVRVDFNVPLNKELGIDDESRILGALPTIKYLVENGAKVILCSHLGRPKGKFVPEMSLAPVAKRLAELLPDVKVAFASDVIGEDAAKKVSELKEGEIVLLENLRFHAEALTWRPIEGISDEEIYHQLQLFSLHGQSKDAFAKTQLGAWEYDVIGTWYKCNMTDVVAAIGLKQLERYPRMLEYRRQIIEYYDDALSEIGVETLPHYTNEYTSSGHLYITRVPNITCEERNEIIQRMAEQGIATNVHYKPLPMHTAYKNLGFNIADFPNAYAHFENEITLPLHTCLTGEMENYVISNYVNIVKDYL